ncbi:hypothetical protein [Dethiosulfovibrio salsuginis]|uniref:Multidrug resistance protein, MATE family n=1 Tax=Dethiosulfovibrio salsuginis TaxID=561720 RepID=A0A1X7KIZ3_9BACT|nr:hypothetical protein [Dethiosulfovibrio salsuginis]SMG41356.1 multidrug resistance protein, MATE family [Dethiosulfovibrio salsuginis]
MRSLWRVSALWGSLVALFMVAYWLMFGPFGNHGLWASLLLFYVGRSLFLLPFLGRTVPS